MFSLWLPQGCWDPQLWCTTEQREKAVGLEASCEHQEQCGETLIPALHIGPG